MSTWAPGPQVSFWGLDAGYSCVGEGTVTKLQVKRLVLTALAILLGYLGKFTLIPRLFIYHSEYRYGLNSTLLMWVINMLPSRDVTSR